MATNTCKLHHYSRLGRTFEERCLSLPPSFLWSSTHAFVSACSSPGSGILPLSCPYRHGPLLAAVPACPARHARSAAVSPTPDTRGTRVSCARQTSVPLGIRCKGKTTKGAFNLQRWAHREKTKSLWIIYQKLISFLFWNGATFRRLYAEWFIAKEILIKNVYVCTERTGTTEPEISWV